MKTSPNPERLTAIPFICSLSGIHVEGTCGCVLRISEMEFPISLASSERLCGMANDQHLWCKRLEDGRLENGVAEIVRIINDARGDEESVMGLVRLDRLHCVADWKTRVDKIILDAQSQADLPTDGCPDGPDEIHTVRPSQLQLAIP